MRDCSGSPPPCAASPWRGMLDKAGVRSGHCRCRAEKTADTGKNGSCNCDSRTCCDMRRYQRNRAHVRRSTSACRGVSTPWVYVIKACSVRIGKTVCTSLRRTLLILIPRAIWHAAHVGCLACFIVKIIGLEPDAARCMALRGGLRQAWRKS